MSLNPESREGIAVADALSDAGWHFGSESDGIRMLVWPDGSGNLTVPLDPARDDYDSLLDSAIGQLIVAQRRGDKAREVLDRLTTEGVIS